MNCELLKEILNYDPLTGLFTWKKSWSGAAIAGRVAGNIASNGYRKIRIKRGNFLAHRLAWLYVHGEWPGEIDHVNHNRDDNRIANLRVVDKTENQRNRSMTSTNKSGCLGVHWNKHARQWRAQIGVKKKQIFLGYFKEKDEAIAARRKAETEYRFHENHGARP